MIRKFTYYFVVSDHSGQALLEGRGGKTSVEFCCDAVDRTPQTLTLSSFLKDENSVSEWPGARGHHEEPLSHCPRRGCVRHRQHAGGHEQRLQEQPTCVVRSDVQRTTAHKIRARLRFGN